MAGDTGFGVKNRSDSPPRRGNKDLESSTSVKKNEIPTNCSRVALEQLPAGRGELGTPVEYV